MNNPAYPQQSSCCPAFDSAPLVSPPEVQPFSACAVGAEKAEERLQRLQKVVAALGKAITLQQVLDAIMADVLATLGAYVGIIALLSEDGSEFHTVRAVGYPPETLQAWTAFPADSPVPVADACKAGEPVFLETVEERRRRYPASPVIALNGRAEASLAALPLMEERPFGAIGLRWQEEHVFDAGERAFMQTLANVCAQAITRARLLDAAQRETQERRQAEAALQESRSHNQERLASLLSDLQRANQELTHSYDAAIEGWSRALDLRDKETEGHSERVTEMTMRLAQAMGLPKSEWVNLRRGALLHDIGKMGIPDTILLKPGPLTDEEWKVMRRHPEYAYELLYPMTFLHPALVIPIAHHEKWDGSGYPHGLKGEQIPLAARIFAVADVWDALRSDRPYRKGWPVEKVREHIRALAGAHFDPQVVKIFLRLDLTPGQERGRG